MAISLFVCEGGSIVLPDTGRALVSREDGGNLIVNPPRDVWERSELTPDELTQWAFLVSAAGRAMIDALPQLEGGCVNYWEVGNWALHEKAIPEGPKSPRAHRRVHLHLLGRSPRAKDERWAWGEAPLYPRFSDRNAGLAGLERLLPAETSAVVDAVDVALRSTYGFEAADFWSRTLCPSCGHSTVRPYARCEECSP
jgi:hypothetical protein